MTASPTAHVDAPMHWTWRLALVTVAGGAACVAAACALELSGLVARDTLLRGASDGERWVALTFVSLLQPFAITALLRGRLRIDGVGVHYLGLGPWCSTSTIEFATVRRWGTAVATNRGRRERHLVFDLHDGRRPSIKVAMYRDVPRILDVLTQRLGGPAPASAGIGGINFDGPL